MCSECDGLVVCDPCGRWESLLGLDVRVTAGCADVAWILSAQQILHLKSETKLHIHIKENIKLFLGY
jgi:hypothetical protein